MTAEPIANVIADIRQGRAANIIAAAEAHNWPGIIPGSGKALWDEALMRARLDQPVIDATPLYRELKAPSRPIHLIGENDRLAEENRQLRARGDTMAGYLAKRHGYMPGASIALARWREVAGE